MSRRRMWVAIALAIALTGLLPRAGAAFTTRTTTTTSFTVAVWSPPQSGLVWWLDSSVTATMFQQSNCTTAVTTAGDPVACWTDRRAGHSAITLPFGQANPTWNGQVRNGRRTVHLGDGQQLTGPDLLGGTTSDMHLFVVTRNASLVTNAPFSLNGTAVDNAPGLTTSRFIAHLPWSDNKWYFDPGGGTENRAQSGAGTTTTGAWTLFEGTKNAGLRRNRFVLNNRLSYQSPATATAAVTTGGLMLGDIGAATTADHDIAEFLVYDHSLTTAEVNQAVAYLTAKWGPWP